MTTAFTTRKPTGKPSWPILLLAGAEKAGKSYSAALATSSPLVGRSYWVTIGEDEPDEYGLIGEFDIVEHDGSYRKTLGAIEWAGRQPLPEKGVPLLVVDSMTRLWDLLKDHAQKTANDRKNRAPGNDATITSDLWNEAAKNWQRVMDAIRAFPGPVILTARLDEVAVMNDAGQPTKEKQRKVQAHKTLPFDVGAIIEMPARGEAWVTGLRSVRYKLSERTRIEGEFTVDKFWRDLGLAELETGSRDHNAPKVADGAVEVADEWTQAVAEITSLNALKALWDDAVKQQVAEFVNRDGKTVKRVMTERRRALQQDAAAEEAVS